MSNGPPYLVYVCPSCATIRHLKLEYDSTYRCLVCGLEFLYKDGRIIRKIEGGGIKDNV